MVLIIFFQHHHTTTQPVTTNRMTTDSQTTMFMNFLTILQSSTLRTMMVISCQMMTLVSIIHRMQKTNIAQPYHLGRQIWFMTNDSYTIVVGNCPVMSTWTIAMMVILTAITAKVAFRATIIILLNHIHHTIQHIMMNNPCQNTTVLCLLLNNKNYLLPINYRLQ